MNTKLKPTLYFSNSILLAIVLFSLFGLVESSLAATDGPAAANLWIVPSGAQSCVRNSAETYAAAVAGNRTCASMQDALSVASGGDTIVMRNGTYGTQSLDTDGKTSTVTFYAQNWQQVLVGNLSINVDNVHTIGISGSGTGLNRATLRMLNLTDIAWTNILVDGFHGLYAVLAGTGITVQNSEFGGVDACATDEEDAFPQNLLPSIMMLSIVPTVV